MAPHRNSSSSNSRARHRSNQASSSSRSSHLRKERRAAAMSMGLRPHAHAERQGVRGAIIALLRGASDSSAAYSVPSRNQVRNQALFLLPSLARSVKWSAVFSYLDSASSPLSAYPEATLALTALPSTICPSRSLKMFSRRSVRTWANHWSTPLKI